MLGGLSMTQCAGCVIVGVLIRLLINRVRSPGGLVQARRRPATGWA